MPLQYKSYGCEFKCGHKHTESLKKILEHEERCWYNPKNKTCVTCRFGELVHDSCDHPEIVGNPTEHWIYRDCYEPHCKEIEFEEDKLFKQKIIPKEYCNYWQGKGESNGHK